MIFVDTSAFYALLDGDDADHAPASKWWEANPPIEGVLVTTNYVVLETMALLQSRIGMAAVRMFHDAFLPLVRVEWIDEILHNQAASALVATGRRGLSLVDLTSFETMRQLGIRSVFTFDRHFKEFGFETVPHPARGRS
jgi:predicted nucleic acid-binding protein